MSTATLNGGAYNLRVGRDPDVVRDEVAKFVKVHDLDFLTYCEGADYADPMAGNLEGYGVHTEFDPRFDTFGARGSARDSGVIVRDGLEVGDLQLHRLERVGWERKPGRVGLHWPRSGVSLPIEGVRVMSVHMPPGPFQGPRFWRRGVAFDTSAHKLRRLGLLWQDEPWLMSGDMNMSKRVPGSDVDPSMAWVAKEVDARITGDGIDYVVGHDVRVTDYRRHRFGGSDHDPITYTVQLEEGTPQR